VNPLAVLERGYAMVIKLDSGQIVRSITQIKSDEYLDIRVQDGSFPVVVQSKDG
jgi:exonuclease VII large subunit